MTNNNKNTQNNNQDVKVVVNVEHPQRKRRATPRKAQPPPPPPPVQNVNIQPLNTTLIQGFNTPDYFNTALTNQQMSLAAMANALKR
jgi:hypothetical protein